MILPINATLSLAAHAPVVTAPKIRHDPDLLIDIKDFKPVVISSTDKSDIHLHSSFTLANLDRDAGERLRALGDFMRTAQQVSSGSLYIGCTPAVAEQVAYLAYWKDYPLEFRIGRTGRNIVVTAHFPKQPEFDCLLAVFYNSRELHAGVQKWFDCLCRLVQDHAMIWQIHMIVDKPTYRKLEEPRLPGPDILVEVVDEE